MPDYEVLIELDQDYTFNPHVNEVIPFFRDLHRTGSSFTCNPIPEGTDYDIIALSAERDLSFLRRFGWTSAREDYIMNDFQSFRKGNINLIVTHQIPFYQKFVTATHLAKRFNLLEKDDRVDLFESIIYGKMINVEVWRPV